MKTYRVSNVERFRKFEHDDEDDLESVIADILGLSEPSVAMEAGTAFHKILELAQPGDSLANVHQDGYRFEIIDNDIEVEVAPIREVRASRIYWVDGEPICISGQLDQIVGRRIEDHKTTKRFDADRYLEGYQWRLYLDIFEADVFRWNVFEIAALDDAETAYRVFGFHRLEQYRYPQLGADCQAIVERFARFVREHIEPVLA